MTTITVAPTVELSNVPPRVRLDVTDTGSSPAYTSATVLRHDPDGVQRPVRTGDGNPLPLSTSGTTRVGLIYDYEAPFGTPVFYTTAENPATVSAQVSVNETRVWLIHPGVPSLSMPITVAEVSERKRSVQQGVFYPMGRAYPVVQTDGQRKAPEYTLSLYSADLNGRDDIESLLEDAGVLLLNVPAGKGWGIGAEYVAVGDLTESRYARYLGFGDRRWDLPLTVVDAPVGGSQAQRTYADVLASYATYTAVRAAYPTYSALLAGP